MNDGDDVLSLIRAFWGSPDADVRVRSLQALFNSKHRLATKFTVEFCEWLAAEMGQALRREPSIFDNDSSGEWTIIDDLFVLAQRGH